MAIACVRRTRQEAAPGPRKPGRHVGACERSTGLRNLGADIGLYRQQRECGFEILSYSAGCGWPVDGPPLDYPFNLARRAARNVQLKRHNYPSRRSRANSSSPEIVSPRSATAKPASSSASSSGDKRTSAPRSRVTTKTSVPSMSDTSSKTTLPEITVPVAICIVESYTASGRNRATISGGNLPWVAAPGRRPSSSVRVAWATAPAGGRRWPLLTLAWGCDRPDVRHRVDADAQERKADRHRCARRSGPVRSVPSMRAEASTEKSPSWAQARISVASSRSIRPCLTKVRTTQVRTRACTPTNAAASRS